MAIRATYETLMEQASATSDTYLRAAIENIDAALGDGYAAKHPELLGAMVRASATDFSMSALIVAIQEATSSLADAVRYRE